MDCKLLLIFLSCVLLAYNAAAELAEEDFRLLEANDINLQQMLFRRRKNHTKTETATRRPTPTLGPNPRPKPSPKVLLKGKKVITIEDFAVDDKPVKPAFNGNYDETDAGDIF